VPEAVIAIVVAWRQRQSATLAEGNFYALYLASLEYYWSRQTVGATAMPDAKDALSLDKALEMFKFYEEAAEKTKGHAWSQTTWILTLNAGILAFSLNLFAAYSTKIPFGAFLVIEWISCIAGLALCGLLFFVIRELGEHIANYWETANKLAVKYAPLSELIGEKTAAKARSPTYREEFPKFCTRLMLPVALFMAAHVVWAIVVTVLMSCVSGLAKFGFGLD
jgi:hypothetical protein